jgi:Na+-driven multidrug efflux pump
MSLFTTDPEVIRIGGEYLLIVSAFYLLLTLMMNFHGVLRGAGDTLIPMFLTLTSLWLIRVPFAWYFSSKLGEVGIWWSAPASWGMGLLLSIGYYLTGRWKRIKVIRPMPVKAGPEGAGSEEIQPEVQAAAAASSSGTSSSSD